MKAKPIPYKDTLAMPGSDLFKYLSAGDAKKAEKCYQETEARHKKLMGVQPNPTVKGDA